MNPILAALIQHFQTPTQGPSSANGIQTSTQGPAPQNAIPMSMAFNGQTPQQQPGLLTKLSGLANGAYNPATGTYTPVNGNTGNSLFSRLGQIGTNLSQFGTTPQGSQQPGGPMQLQPPVQQQGSLFQRLFGGS